MELNERERLDGVSGRRVSDASDDGDGDGDGDGDADIDIDSDSDDDAVLEVLETGVMFSRSELSAADTAADISTADIV
jgi:hypothetical protein